MSDQQQTIQRVTEGVDLFNQLTQSGAATALIFAAILGLGIALAVRVPAHEFIERDRLANWAVWMSFILGGFLACWWLWPPGEWRPRMAFSLAVGFSTPAIWWAFSKVIGLINPTLGKALSLNRVFEEETPAEPPDPPKP